MRVLRLIAAASVLLSFGCRPGEGERCFCEGECRGGLACAVGGAVLREGQCIDAAMASSVDAGVCIEGGNADIADNDLNPPPFLDLGPWATETTPVPDPTSDATATDTDTTASTTDASTTAATGTTAEGSDSSASTSTGTGTGSSSETGSTQSTDAATSSSTGASG